MTQHPPMAHAHPLRWTHMARKRTSQDNPQSAHKTPQNSFKLICYSLRKDEPSDIKLIAVKITCHFDHLHLELPH